jgi:3-hydroxymyristoyl/3-hydroxydecanoyl-(acyl carrier protein) dehydratase
MNDSAASDEVCIDARHPALPGHFPGRPVVPGVVLLDRVAAAIERRFDRVIAGLPQVKFLQPLLPGQSAVLELHADPAAVRFTLARDGAIIAAGSVEARAR